MVVWVIFQGFLSFTKMIDLRTDPLSLAPSREGRENPGFPDELMPFDEGCPQGGGQSGGYQAFA